MAETSWVTNRYLRATRGNFTRTSTIGNDVAGVLEARAPGNAAINTLYNYFLPKNQAYQTKFGLLDTASGNKEGATEGLKQTIAGMRAKANAWKKAIGNVYDEHSEEYKAILPDGIGKLTEGKQASILQATEGLSGRLAGIVALAATKADVDATYTLLNTKNLTQKGKIGVRDSVSEDLEQERVNLCKALLYVEAGLTQIFIDDLAEVDSFFPLELLRRKEQTEFTGTVSAGEPKFIVKRKMNGSDELTLKNDGTVALTFYFAPMKNSPLDPGMQSKTIAAMHELTTTAAEVGATEDNVYLIVASDEAGMAHWMVTI